MYTEVIVETCEIQNFGGFVSGQISIIYPGTYLYSTSAEVSYYSKVGSSFSFPFYIDEKGVPIGTYSTTDNVTLVNSGDVTGFNILVVYVFPPSDLCSVNEIHDFIALISEITVSIANFISDSRCCFS